MNLQDVADIVTILTFVGAVGCKVWCFIKDPLFTMIVSVIDAVIAFLQRMRERIKSRANDDDVSSIMVWRAVASDIYPLRIS